MPTTLLLLALASADAASASAKARRTDGAIVVDGSLEEDAWASAATHEVLHQKLPRYGDPARQPTSFRVLADDRALYFGIRCERADGVEMTPRSTRRDRDIESDRITIDIDSRGLAADAFHFEVTAGGSVVDGIRYNDTQIDTQWDGVWSAAVTRDPDGYTVEVEIPFAALRRPAGSEAALGLQVRRYTTALGETDEWAPTPRDGSQEVSRYGALEGVAVPARRIAFGALPYVALGGAFARGAGRTMAFPRRAGVDASLRIGSDFALDAAALPDFGNVEADTAVVNLTTVEVRFPEKRPFFLEGVDMLETPLSLFYSRRIGSLTGTTTGTRTTPADPAPVLGATKLLARAGSRWGFAALGAVTQSQTSPVRDAESQKGAPQQVLPMLVYALGRVRRSLSNAGFVALTYGTRVGADSAPRAPWTACSLGGAPVRGRCTADVHVLSADTRIRSRTGMFVATGQVLGTARVGGRPEVQLDGNELASGDVGAAAMGSIAKTGGRMIGELRYDWLGRDAEWNAIGYLPQPNRHTAWLDLGLQTLTPHGPVLEDRWQLEVFHRFTLDGLPNGSGYQVNHRARWRSMWQTFFELHVRPSYWDVREARDGTPYQRAGLIGVEPELTSDPRKRVIASVAGVAQVRRVGPRFEGQVDVDVNVHEIVQLRFGLTGTSDHGEPRFVGRDDAIGTHRFARLYADALGVVGRLNLTLPRQVEIQLYGQALGVQTRWRDNLSAAHGDARILQRELQRGSIAAPAGEREAILVGNLFLRWEYRRGSNLWLLVTRNPLETVFDDGMGGIDLARVARLPASWLVMVKLTLLIEQQRPLRRGQARTRRRRRDTARLRHRHGGGILAGR